MRTPATTNRGSGWPGPNGASARQDAGRQRRRTAQATARRRSRSARSRSRVGGIDGEALGEKGQQRVDPAGLDGEAGRHGVAAALEQQAGRGGGVDGRAQVDARHRAARGDAAAVRPAPTTTAGRRKRSTRRLATMPTTPGCQPSPAAHSSGPRSPAAAMRASALSSTACSIAWRSRLSASSRCASCCASAGSSVGQQPGAEVGLADPAAGVDARADDEAQIARRGWPPSGRRDRPGRAGRRCRGAPSPSGLASRRRG